jgi:mRNA interferase RelE/StbE
LLSKTACSQLNSFDKDIKERIKTNLKDLQENPFKDRSGTDIKKLISTSKPPLFRIRIGDYRAVYFILDDEVKITQIFHRSKGYKWLN